MSPQQISQLPRDRTTRRYEPVLNWCEWLLSMASPALSAGITHAPGLLFDMNKLFEAYVCGIEETAVDDRHIVHRQGPSGALAREGDKNAFILRPDITVWHADANGIRDGIVRVVDAKWKRLDPQAANWGIDQADVYQMLAYAMHYQCERLELVYPALDRAVQGVEELPVFRVALHGGRRQGIEVRVRTVPLWRGSMDVMG